MRYLLSLFLLLAEGVQRGTTGDTNRIIRTGHARVPLPTTTDS